MGSITELTDQSGNLVERYEYDVYGMPQFFDSDGNALTASAIGNTFLFTGRYYDPESGNYDYRARMYSPALGRFLQTDPLGYVDGLNLYAYVGNNPATWSDPYGLVTGVEVAVGCLATSPCREIVIGGTIAVSLAIGQAARSVYESLPPVYIPPFPTIGVAPSDDHPYIYRQPSGSLLIPRLPSVREYCDPGEVSPSLAKKIKPWERPFPGTPKKKNSSSDEQDENKDEQQTHTIQEEAQKIDSSQGDFRLDMCLAFCRARFRNNFIKRWGCYGLCLFGTQG